MKKTIALLLVLCLLLPLLAGCHQNDGESPTVEPTDTMGYHPIPLSEECFAEQLRNATSFDIWILDVNATETMRYTVKQDGQWKGFTLNGATKVYSTSSPDALADFRSFFDGWTLTDNRIPMMDALNATMDIYVVLNHSGLAFLLSSDPNIGTRGSFSCRGFYLPDAFCNYVRNILSSI